ncbi:MAG: ABC transporter ATP-binding protein [Alphaproteobacteria bacterium]|nr:ABC transporter ATP-binding protein [Alphaproteobacteria bacterium]
MIDAVDDVRLERVRKTFGSVVAVDDVSLSIAKGAIVSLLGPSGCGKTTTLRLIAGFERPSAGGVHIRGARVNDVPPYRRDFGMVFQSYALFPHLTVADNVAFGLKMRRVSRDERTRRVAEALALVKLDGFADRTPRQLSGGQQQRVALARAIVFNPAVLLLDEPLGALDKMLREEMQVELRQLQQRLGITTVFVTHDQEEALTLSDQVAVMRNGLIEQIGAPRAIYERPATEFVAGFLGASNFFDGRVVERGCVEIAGRRFPVAAATQAGAPVRLAIRPERVSLTASDADGLPATLRDVIFRGSTVHFYLDSAIGPILAYRQNADDGDRAWERGQRVSCGWAPESAVVVVPLEAGAR